jgi:two-component system response regulator DesR
MIRILIAVDMNLLRTALATLLSYRDGVTVVAGTDCAGVTVELIATIKPDVAVIDLDTRRDAPLAALDTLNERAPDCGIIALTGVAAPTAIRRALNARIRGCLSKDCGIDDLMTAIVRVGAGERFIEPGVAIAALAVPDNPLTAREVDVLRLAADGLSPAEIADSLFLTSGTVRNYLSVIVRKLGARSRVDAVRRAAESNWI